MQSAPSQLLSEMLTRVPPVPTAVALPVRVMVPMVWVPRATVMTQSLLPVPPAAPVWVWPPFPAHTTIFSLWALVAPTS